LSVDCPRCSGLLVLDESEDHGLRLKQFKCLICAFRSRGKIEGVAEDTIAAGRYAPTKKRSNPYHRKKHEP
jgi:hypothetical protein